MFYLRICILITLLLTICFCVPIIPEEDSKHLENPIAYEGRRRHRPLFGSNTPAGCNFNGLKGGKKQNEQKGRTFFDFDFFNIGYNHEYNINCGNLGPENGGGGIVPHHQGPNVPYRPNRPHRPIGGHHNMDHQGNVYGFWSGFLGPFSQSQAQSDSGPQTFNEAAVSSVGNPSFADLLPSPQQVGNGLGQGIVGFLQTIPQIGQSFQSLLPNFDNFQWPTLPSLPPLPILSHGSISNPTAASPPAITEPPSVSINNPITEAPTDPVDPDDTIYNEEIKPVHENHDPITDPVKNKLPAGQARYFQNYRRYQDERANYYSYQNRNNYQNYNRYSQQKAEPRQYNRQQNEGYSKRAEGRSFRFPS